MTTATEELRAQLHHGFKGDLLVPGSAAYEAARSVWNGMFDRTPALIARCSGAADVQHAVRAAAQSGIIAAVRCGGHSLAGFSTCDDGLVIDLSRMRDVIVSPEARQASFSGGCLLGSVDAATQRAGLVFPSGVVSHTGAGGLVLGGGTGWLTRCFGLSCDNVAGFSLVTADGTLVRATESENRDLFWALRGGGGNFGIVTEFHVRLHPLASVVLAEGLSARNDIGNTLLFWRDYMAAAPLDLKWNINLRLAPLSSNVPAPLRGQPVAASGIVWTGASDAALSHLKRALSPCAAHSRQIRNLSFLNLQTMADSDFPHGRRYYTKSGYFQHLEQSTIDLLLEAVDDLPSPESMIELAYLGGMAAEFPAAETAFGDRSAPFVLTLLANWSDAADDAAHISWARGLFNRLKPAMKPGVYVNFMSGDEQDRVPEAYRERWDRLVAIKSHYDPGNFFRLNQNVRPAGWSSNTHTASPRG